MRVALPTLKALLLRDVLEIKFTRRRLVAGKPATRRMLCTNSSLVLRTQPGREALHFRDTTRGPRYNPDTKNLVLAWDIFKQDYRMINCDNVTVIAQIPGDDEFWNYFNTTLSRMSAAQKQTFFDI